jgi:hypothetical protein
MAAVLATMSSAFAFLFFAGQLRFGDRSRRGREVLDAGTGCRFRSKQHGGKWCDLATEFSVEAGDVVAGVFHVGECGGCQRELQVGDRVRDRRLVGAALAGARV